MSEANSVSAKEKWAAKQVERGAKALEKPIEDRLPPGQHLTNGFPVLDLGIQPGISHSEWRLEIDGLVQEPVELDWEGLQSLGKVSVVSDFHCRENTEDRRASLSQSCTPGREPSLSNRSTSWKKTNSATGRPEGSPIRRIRSRRIATSKSDRKLRWSVKGFFKIVLIFCLEGVAV